GDATIISAGAGNDTITTGSGRDRIFAEAGNDTLIAAAGNDDLSGGDGDDLLNGVNPNSSTPGLGERDNLSGGTGGDRFILGDTANIYYDDRNTSTNGTNDYATIADFNPSQDKVQLQGAASNYRLEISGANTNLYLDKAGSEPDELIGVFQNITGLNLTSSAFEYVAPDVVAPTHTVNFDSASYTVNENGTAQITLIRSGSPVGQTSLDVFLSNGTATAPADYNNAPLSVVFNDGETTKTITIPIVNDSQFEPNETINLALTNLSNDAALGTQNTATLTIINDDPLAPGTLAFGAAQFSVNENGTPVAAITVTRTGGSDGAVSVTLTPTNGTATAPADYTSNPIAVSFADGETSKIVTIPIADDTLFEADETINLTLSNATNGATLGTQTTATLTIVNNDAPQQGVLAFSNPTYSIGEDGTAIAAVTVTRSGGSDGAVSATINLSNGSAIAPGDYSNTPITVSFADGDTAAKTITIPIVNDTSVEATETINLSLTNPTGGATIGTQSSAIVNIVDDDDVQLNFSAVNYTVNEDGTAVTEILITRTGSSTGAVSATISFADGTATGCTCAANSVNNDFYNGTFTVTLADGETSKIVPVQLASLGGSNAIRIRDDAKVEGNETFTISLINPTGGATIGNQGSATVTIVDNDVAPQLTVTFNPNVIAENAGNSAATGTVTRDQVTDTALVVNLTSSDPTEATVPQTVTIAAGQASATFRINAVDDTAVDGTQTVTITATPLNPETNTPLVEGAGSNTLQVTDNESPSLSLSLDKNIISETGTATATITRNTDSTEALTVTLASSDTTEATVPQTVTILAGETSATFIVTGVNDGVSDGIQSVTLTATANGLNNGVQTLEVSDLEIPDLQITNLAPTASPLYTGKQAFLTYKVENRGLTGATGSWSDKVYLSTDNKLDSNDSLISETTFTPNIPFNSFYERSIPFFAPTTAGQYYLIATTDAANTVNEGTGLGEQNNTLITPITVTPAYRATVSTDLEVGTNGQAVTLRGSAVNNADNSPVAFEFVTIKVENNGIVRELSAFTDANGNFVKAFNPLPTEGGLYNINAYFPSNPNEDSAPEDSFKLLGMRFNASQSSHKVIANSPFTASVDLANLTSFGLTGITATVDSVVEGWNVQVNAPSVLNGSGNNPISYTITAPNDSEITQDTFNIKLTSAEGVTAILPVNVNLERNLPRLVASTNLVSGGMLRGDQTIVEFEVTNEGGAVAENIEVLLPDVPWLKLASPATISALNPGQSTKLTLLLTPDADLPLTEYTGNLFLDAAGNDGDLSVDFNFRAVSEAKGNISINTVDELFYFAEGAPKLANATVTLRDYFTNAIIATAVTDETGLLNLSNINEGFYNIEIKADKHDTFRQTIQLDAGETENISAFLSRQTVQYIWNVTSTEIEDKYNITVQSVFETDVPIPIVVIDPPLIDLEDLQVVGQVMQVDMTITNHGLIAANDFKLNFGEHPFYKIEPLINNIDALSAKSSITIPIRITRIADFDTLLRNNGELQALAAQPSVPCGISGSGEWSFLCGLIKVGKSTGIAINNVEGNCPIGDPIFVGRGGDGGGDSDVYSITPVIVNAPNLCCLIPKIDFNADLGLKQLLEALAGRAVDEIKNRLGLDLKGQLKIDAKVGGSIESCCDKNIPEIKIEVKGQADVAVTLGKQLGIPERKISYTNFELVANQTTIGFEAKPSIEVVGRIYKDCGKNWCFEISGTGKIDIFTGIETKGTATLKAGVDPITGSNKQEVSMTGAIKGSVSLSLGYDCKRGRFFCLSSDGLYAEVQGTAFGQAVSPFDNPSTETVETRLCIVGPAYIGECFDPKEPPKNLCGITLFSELSQLLTAETDLQSFVETDLQNFLEAWFVQTVQPEVENLLERYNLPADSISFDPVIENPDEPEPPIQDPNSVCAKVRISIDQEAVMTRSAFLGSLEIDNGNPTNLTNLSVTLQIKDENGNVVNDLFGITNPILKNITAVDGTGILIGDDPNTPQDEGIGSAEWTFIPTNLAAPQVPTTYSIGGTLSYTENGQVINVPLLSTGITVLPQAELYLDYFQSRNVYGDDPFTDATEVAVPFDLAVLVRNQGYGDAKNLQITSSQPKIIENEKGLLIDFNIIGSQLNGEDVTPSLAVNFGDIAAGETAVANWLLKSTLQGKFIEYKATFEHVNGLGNKELSLIKEVKIHELIQKVKADGDSLPDFLVNDTFDAKFYPDTLYFSDGTTAPVTAIDNATVDAPVTLFDLSAIVTATATSGWSYITLTDPANGQFQIKELRRADGTLVNLDNIWRTDRTFPATGRPIYENVLHFLDKDSTGTYTIIYDSNDNAPPQVREIVDVAPNPRNSAVDSLTVVFTEPIRTNTFDPQDITLTLDGGANLITNGVTVSQIDPTTFQINNLTGITGNIGQYQLSINGTGIQDLTGNAGAGIVNETWTFTGDRPGIASIVGFNATLLNAPVNSFDVIFTEAIVPSSFDYTDIILRRNNGENLVNNTVTITQIDATTFRVGNFSPFTTPEGDYQLLVTANGVQDTDGNNGVGGKGFNWVLDTTVPSLTNITNLTSPRNTAVASLEISFSQAINPTTLNFSDLILTRDGSANLITNSVTLEKRTETTYTIKGLTGLQTDSGVYTLTVNGTGIQDTAGNSVGNSLTQTWTLDRILPGLPTNIQVIATPASQQQTSSLGILNQAGQFRVNSQNITITGNLAESNLRVYIKDLTTNQDLGQATVTGTSFTGNIQLPSPGSRNLEIRVQDAAGNASTATLGVFADLTKPTITQFLNLPSSSPDPVNSIDVQFSEQIDLNSFNKSDLTLTRNGATLTLPAGVAVEYLSGTTYRISGLGSLTNLPGTYSLQVDATTIQDNAGNSGDAPKTANFTIATPATPGITLTQTGGNTSVTEGGNTDTYSLVLKTQPTAEVTITLAVGAQITTNTNTLIFTPTNWNTPQTVTVTAVNDTTPEGSHTATIAHTVSSSDTNYNAAALPNLSVSIADNDAEIQGMKWNDRDGDGLKETGELGLSGWTIYLDSNTNGQLDNGETSTTTDAQGNYRFTDLRPGTYTVAEVMQTGWKQTYPGVSVTTTASNIQLHTPNSPLVSAETYSATAATNLINLDGFWADSRFANIKGQGYSTVIIDTGIDLDHPFFGADNNNNGVADKIIYQYDFADHDADASDKNNHGSHIASIAASIAPNASLIVLKVFKDDGSGYFADLEKALQWVNQNATAYNIASVNLSLGDGQNWTTPVSRYGIGDELAAIASQNILISAAAGNSFYQYNSAVGLAYPAIDPNTISVGAIWAENFGSKPFSNGAVDYSTDGDRIASFSQRHPLLDVFAPGILITGANATGGTITMGGTSQATPYLSSIATLAQQIAQQYLGRELTLNDFRTLLDNTSDLIIDGDDENDNVTNTGKNYPRVNILALAEGILTLNTSPPNPDPVDPDNQDEDTGSTPSAATSLVHTVTLTAGQTATSLDFGNQKLDRPPTVANPIANVTVSEDANNTLIDLSNVFSDLDEDAIAISIFSNTNPGLVTATLVNNQLSLDYQANQSGAAQINVRGTANGQFVDDIFTITINSVNDAPILGNPILDQTATEDAAFSFTVPANTFSDVDVSDVLTYAATLANGNSLPNWLTFNPATRTFSGTPTDADLTTLSIKVTTTDNAGETASDTFTLEVNPNNNLPDGTPGADSLLGSDRDDIFNGGAGNDVITARKGNDTLTGGGDRDTFVIRLGDGTDTVTDFRSVGKGSQPTQPVIGETDTIKFEGAGLTARNMLLTQKGSSLEIAFEGIDNPKVILNNFALENLDNLSQASGAKVNLGSILFNGQTTVQDSFDVFDANLTRTTIWNRNSVTFLNDLNNTTKGFDNSNDVINAQGGNDTIDGLSGNDLLRGGAGNDSLKGGLGNDTLLGNEGNDVLAGGADNDILTGGSGQDRFSFDINAAFNLALIGQDTITDFALTLDKVVLDKTTFTALKSIAGNGFSIGSEFAAVTTDAAARTSTALIAYNNSNGKLFYNQNGSSSGLGSGGLFATLTGNPSLTSSNFELIA
ncbi:MAG: S8 family serine peptidase, partial [Aphanocapsa sp. GSE-SYN-MK-11-07L]|nr:S8 family serine peptidase [Aphanocapsa sp. GSE-SYN-MK-11-07L]